MGDFMRLRNVKGASEIIENSLYVIKNPEEYKGKYSMVIGFIQRNFFVI